MVFYDNLFYLILFLFIRCLYSMAEVALCTVERDNHHYSKERISKLKIPLKNIKTALTSVDITNLLLDIGAGAIIITDVSKTFFVGKATFKSVLTGNILYVFVLFAISFLYITILSIYIRSVSRPLGRSYAIEIIAYLKVFIKVVQVIFMPVTVIVNIISQCIMKNFNTDIKETDITEEEFLKMLESNGENSTIDETEKEMINKIFDFDQKSADEIATHRKDIIAVDEKADIDAILKIITEEKYSRFPVYSGNIDNIVGIFHIKDIIKNITNSDKEKFDIKNILMKPYYIPQNKKIDELFEEMQKNKVQMCIVLDEYGGTLGIVTTEDIIEEVMGNILDEYDEEEIPDIYLNSEDIFIISGTASLDEVADKLKEDFPLDEYDTMGGFLIGLLGDIPKENESPQIEYKSYIFKCLSIENNCITSVSAQKIKPAEE